MVVDMEMEEYLVLQEDGSYELVMRGNECSANGIKVPEGAEILYFDKRYKPSNHFFKTLNGKSYYKLFF